jgi:uncharacterized protein involved in outer membrane biogenesis
MKNRIGRNVAVYLLACLGASYILLLTAILSVPQFIDRGSVGDNLRSEVSKLVNGEFDLKCRDPSLFPMPPVLLADETLNLLQRITSSAQVIEAYLEILPLLTGKINLNNARMQQQDLNIMRPKPTPGDSAPASVIAN